MRTFLRSESSHLRNSSNKLVKAYVKSGSKFADKELDFGTEEVRFIDFEAVNPLGRELKSSLCSQTKIIDGAGYILFTSGSSSPLQQTIPIYYLSGSYIHNVKQAYYSNS